MVQFQGDPPHKLLQLLLQCMIQNLLNREILEVNSYKGLIKLILEMSRCNYNSNRVPIVQLKPSTINSMKSDNRRLPFNSSKAKPLLHSNNNNRCSNKEWNHVVANRRDHLLNLVGNEKQKLRIAQPWKRMLRARNLTLNCQFLLKTRCSKPNQK